MVRTSTEVRLLSNPSEILNHASTATAVVLDAAGNPVRRVQLLPMGRIEARDGRGPWVLADKAHAQEVVAATQALLKPQDLMFDYDHQAVFGIGPGVGGRAEASGWVDTDTLTVEDDGIWASVSWTDEAAAKLKARAYRYISPYFGSDKTTGRITRLFNAGLVNQPAIREIAAAASVAHNPPGQSMLKTIAARLALAETATETDICASIATLQAAAKASEQLAATAVALGLATTATGEEVLAAASTLKASGVDATKFVPIETHNAATAQLKVINEERAAAAVDRAIEGGKIAPANRDWAIGYFAKDETGFAAFVQGQPAVLTPGGGKTTAKPDAEGKIELTAEDRQACAALGITDEAFLAQRKKEVA